MLERILDEDIRNKIKNEPGRLTSDLESVMISLAKNEPKYEGMRVTEIGELENKNPMDVVLDILLVEKGQVSMVVFGMSEEDVIRVMKSPYMMVSSDGKGISPRGILGKGKPHPRYYGSFPRVLGHYVRGGVLTLQEAIRKMTSAPAQRLGLMDRGLIRERYKADITVFDPDTIKDNATFKDPHKFPSGISYVIVNGKLVIEKGKHNGELPGRVIRKNNFND
jgi:N-acyl-D-amino-acid deacylase